MAGRKIVMVQANVNIKYDDECFKVGDQFKIRKEDKEHLIDNGYASLFEEIDDEPNDNEAEEDKGAGEGGEE